MSAALVSKIKKKHHTPPHDLEINGVYPVGIRLQPITKGRRKKDIKSYEALLLVNEQEELGNYLEALYQDHNKSFQLFEHVTNQAIEYFSRNEGNFSINVTPENILHSRFQKFLDSIEIFSTERILLEVLEHPTQFREDIDFVVENLKKVRKKWYRVAIDDYGTSHSNLERLEYFIKEKIIDVLKIDGSLFQEALIKNDNSTSEESHFTEIRNTIKVAFSNNIRVTIEKIEDTEWVGIIYNMALEIWREMQKTNKQIEELIWFQWYALGKIIILREDKIKAPAHKETKHWV